ncbi:DUF429 domain-containing protein [Jeotgalibacillus sp. S-D1]|uniref:DUF429 domain-containing protein n=1 Tax=Jeotgalibacillus sp. S-D1 TaxID=2552189 RepID=UPI001059B15A|nr:DUF429 domain-containing protein [Jeotgalibacillus sp. S-D1]TDL31064.1 DUF429 domain-containing protein [Jeotgalibacillus sp. S-D1]
MIFDTVIGIGWDVGGWMGHNHGVAICQWERRTNQIVWRGKAAEISIPAQGLLSLKQLTSEVEPAFTFEDIGMNTLIVIGIDAPLGFPAAFNRLINGEKPEMQKPDKEINNPLAYRVTDREIYSVFGKKPLSASYDRIGNNATAAMMHTKLWENEGFKTLPFQTATESDRRLIIEVYPALVKEKRFEEAHNKIRRFIPDDAVPGTDAYDACICALYAVAYGSQGNVLPELQSPPENKAEEIKEEGWIYYFSQKNLPTD